MNQTQPLLQTPRQESMEPSLMELGEPRAAANHCCDTKPSGSDRPATKRVEQTVAPNRAVASTARHAKIPSAKRAAVDAHRNKATGQSPKGTPAARLTPRKADA